MIESASKFFLDLHNFEKDLGTKPNRLSTDQAGFQHQHVIAHVGSAAAWTDALSHFCADLPPEEDSPAKALLLFGPEGCGKTHHTIQWLEQRRIQNEASGASELLLYYNAGLSRESHWLKTFLYFCIQKLCSTFDLEFEVEAVEQDEEAAWCCAFAEMLSQASDAGRVVLVLDGLERLHMQCGQHAGLAWIPAELHPNIRLVLLCRKPLNVEEVAQAGGEEVASRSPRAVTPAYVEEDAGWLIEEARGAGFKVAEVDANEHSCRTLIQAFLQKHGDLRLLDIQIEQLAAHPLCKGNLSFLFAVLKVLRCCALLCLDVSNIVTRCMEISSLKDLYAYSIQALTCGNSPTNASVYSAWKVAKSGKSILLPVVRGIPNLPSEEELKEREKIELRAQGGHARSRTPEYTASQVTLSGMSHLPVYLLGGRDVPGVYGLKHAFALTRLARYGLTFDELSVLVKHLQAVERKDDISTSNLASLYLVLQTLDLVNAKDMVAIPPGCGSLCTCIDESIVRDKEHLPKLIEAAQKLDLTEDIAGADMEKPSKVWRGLLIAYFTVQTACTRQLEELPWLYQANRQWKDLRAFLTDIPTFKKLWRGSTDLRKDLIAYWRILATNSKTSATSNSSSSCNKLVGETSANTAACYDIVEEYTRAIDLWKSGKRLKESNACSSIPSQEDVCRVISAITELLLLFGSCEATSIPYLHSPVVDNSLTSLGVILPHASEEWINEGFVHTEQSKLSLSATAGSLLQFDRLIHAILSKLTATLARKTSDQMDKRHDSHSDAIAKAQRVIAEQSKLYCYQRWVWIHFPELACAFVETARVDKMPQKKGRAKSFFDLKVVTPTNSGTASKRPPSLHKVFEIVPRVKERRDTKLQFALDRLEVPWEESLGAQKGELPFSSPSMKSQRTGTRFPTFDSLQKQNLDISHILAGESKANVYLNELTGNGSTSTGFEGKKGERQHLKLEEVVDKLREDMNRTLFISSTLCDELDGLRKEAKEQTELERRQQTYLQKGSSLIADLEKKLTLLEDVLEAECERQYKYERIRNACEAFPAKDEKHLGLFERVLARIHNESHNLKIQKDQLVAHNKKVAKEEISRLSAAIGERRTMYADVLQKLSGHRKIQQQRIKEKLRRFKKREELAKRIRKADVELTQKKLIKLSEQQQQYKDELDEQVQNQKDMLTYYKKATERIIKKTGVANLDEYRTKFLEMKTRHEELQTKVRRLESTVEDKKLGYHGLLNELKALNIEAENSKSEEMKSAEREVEIADRRLEEVTQKAKDNEELLKLSRDRLYELKRLFKFPDLFTNQKSETTMGEEFSRLERCSALVESVLSVLSHS